MEKKMIYISTVKAVTLKWYHCSRNTIAALLTETQHHQYCEKRLCSLFGWLYTWNFRRLLCAINNSKRFFEINYTFLQSKGACIKRKHKFSISYVRLYVFYQIRYKLKSVYLCITWKWNLYSKKRDFTAHSQRSWCIKVYYSSCLDILFHKIVILWPFTLASMVEYYIKTSLSHFALLIYCWCLFFRQNISYLYTQYNIHFGVPNNKKTASMTIISLFSAQKNVLFINILQS